MKKKKVVQKKNRLVDNWRIRGFSSPQHAEGFNYFNRKDTEDDLIEIQEYCSGEN